MHPGAGQWHRAVPFGVHREVLKDDLCTGWQVASEHLPVHVCHAIGDKALYAEVGPRHRAPTIAPHDGRDGNGAVAPTKPNPHATRRTSGASRREARAGTTRAAMPTTLGRLARHPKEMCALQVVSAARTFFRGQYAIGVDFTLVLGSKRITGRFGCPSTIVVSRPPFGGGDAGDDGSVVIVAGGHGKRIPGVVCSVPISKPAAGEGRRKPATSHLVQHGADL